MENIVELASPEYAPTLHDVLLCRNRTSGVSEFAFRFKEQDFTIVDVGGQRAERRKWIHSFDHVNLLLFFASLGEYDQTLEEDHRVNRLNESLRLFAEIANSKWFETVPLALVLNKRDILAEKIKVRDLSMTFPDYTAGLDSYDNAVKFITAKFIESTRSDRELYIHVTCATDSNCIRDVFDDLANHMLHKSFDAAGV